MGDTEEETAPFTQAFLEQLFGVLRDDFATLKQEKATEVDDLRRDMGNLGQRVDSLEHTHESGIRALARRTRAGPNRNEKTTHSKHGEMETTQTYEDREPQRKDGAAELEITHKTTVSLAIWQQLNAARKLLRALDMGRAEYALLQTKQKCYRGGNKAGHLLAQLLRSQAIAQGVTELQLSDGTTLQLDEQTAVEFADFYTALYSEEEIAGASIEAFLDAVLLSSISPVSARCLDKDITPAEVLMTIQRLKPDFRLHRRVAPGLQDSVGLWTTWDMLIRYILIRSGSSVGSIKLTFVSHCGGGNFCSGGCLDA
ncbi:hypothetical protein NDU88_004541 [Pleurodeles waltl]|uniref:Uncharacterized protein n=1 Tax=Pleurodeles waltl TaxID=8319 RepID=A0AAV7NK32_PLEWA|nr:hypothetical protein NDU88_004541 [Pleurodeles waltl]